MRSIRFSALYLLVLLLLSVFINSYIQIEQSPFDIQACEEECNNLLDPSSQVESARQQLQLLIAMILSGDVQLRAFIQRLGRSHPRVVNTIVRNQHFFAQNVFYSNYFYFRYETQLQSAVISSGFTSCPRINSSTLYPTFTSNRTGVPSYMNISDQLNKRPPAYSQTDGFWSYRHKYLTANLSNLNETDRRYGFAPLIGIAQQAYCFIELYKEFDQSIRTIIFPPATQSEVSPSFFQHWDHLDSQLEYEDFLAAARSEIAEWLSLVSIEDLYNYVSFSSFIAFETDILDIMDICQSGIGYDENCYQNGTNLTQQP